MSKLTFKHLRQAGFCAKGIRQYCWSHNLDYDHFRKNGENIETAQQQDPVLLRKAIEIAEKEANKGK